MSISVYICLYFALHYTVYNSLHGPIEAKGKEWSAEEEAKFKQPTLDKYETEGHAYYSSARLWDDGVINPRDTRKILGLSFGIAMKNPVPETKFGVFRM